MLYRATVPVDHPKSPGLGAGRAPGSTKKRYCYELKAQQTLFINKLVVQKIGDLIGPNYQGFFF